MSIGHKEERQEAFLAIPPFPRRKVDGFVRSTTAALIDDAEADLLIALLRNERVGGRYWGPRPPLSDEPYVLVSGSCTKLPNQSCIRIGAMDAAGVGDESSSVPYGCDPWHLLRGASSLWCGPGDPLRIIAGIMSVPVRSCEGEGEATVLDQAELRALLRQALGEYLYFDPFGISPLGWREVIELCGHWRRLIDANRRITAVYGFAAWKRTTTEPLLWDGTDQARFDRPIRSLRTGDKVALWRSRTPADHLNAIAEIGAVPVEVEDGFIRSAGLGAECVPPQSIIVDESGVHFDARRPSALEQLLENGSFDADLLARAEALRRRIVSLGLSKYDSGQSRLERRNDRPHVLVPGQVEDDRAVLSSIGEPLTNRELLRRVRAVRPDAHIIYKPHPDVEAGHRRGVVPRLTALEDADEVGIEGSIASWIDLADEVHVNTSLAGFEALMRGKRVSTYGVPFYAGWGLTDDHGPVPARRTARRSLSELMAAALIVAPRYVDPETNLPCSPEVLVERLASASSGPPPSGTLLISARRLQGWLNRTFMPSSRR